MNETHKTIFKSVQIELISFGIIYLFIVLFCLQFLCFYCHFSLFRNWLFFLFSMNLNNTNETWKKLEECRNLEKIVEKNILHSSTNFSFLLISSTKIGKFVQNKGKLPKFQQFDFLVNIVIFFVNI